MKLVQSSLKSNSEGKEHTRWNPCIFSCDKFFFHAHNTILQSTHAWWKRNIFWRALTKLLYEAGPLFARARSQAEKKPNKRRRCVRKKMRKEKPMIFLRWRKVKAVAAEQTSVGRNLRSISEQAISLSKQKGGYRGLSFGKKGERGEWKGAEMEENRWSTFVGSPVEQSGNRIDNFTSFLDYRIRGSPRRSYTVIVSHSSHQPRIFRKWQTAFRNCSRKIVYYKWVYLNILL